ncbi:MAG: hypothetical protein ABIY37_01235, partial [Devosia sp.]
GILLAEDLIENTPLLRTLVGKDLRGHIRRAGIMFRIQDLCLKGDLPFTAEMLPMPHGNWHWLELRSRTFKAHVCRTDGPSEFPVETLSRQDARLSNIPDLFSENVVPIDQVAAQLRVLYSWLTFGVGPDRRLSHLCWAMPPAGDGEWLAHVNVLRRVADTALEPKAPEAPSEPIKLRFKENIERALTKEADEEKTKD